MKAFTTAFDATVISTLSFVRIHSADQFRHQKNNLLTHTDDDKEHPAMLSNFRTLNKQVSVTAGQHRCFIELSSALISGTEQRP